MRAVLAIVGPLGGPEGVVMGPLADAARAAATAAAAVVGLDLEVRLLDDDRDPAVAAELVAALGADQDVIGVVGPKNSGSALAARAAAEAAGLPLVLPAATAPDLAGPGQVLRMCDDDRATARALVALVEEEGLVPLAVESDATAYGRSLAAAVAAEADRRGLARADAPDGAGALVLAMGEVEQAARMRALRAAGFTGALLGAEGGPGAPIVALAGAAAEGSWQVYPGAVIAGADAVYVAEAADAATALVTALAATHDRRSIAAHLRRTDVTPASGRLGPLRFDADGLRIGAAVSRWRIVAGRCVPVRA